MSNTNNHDGLILMIAATAVIAVYDQYHDRYQAKAASKFASHFSVLKVPSVIRENDDKDEQNKQPTIANK